MIGALIAGVMLSAPVPAQAQQVVAVLSSDLGAYREAYEGLVEGLGAPVPTIAVGQRVRLSPSTKVVVTFGAKAAFKHYPDGVTVIYCMAPGLVLEEEEGGPRLVRVRMEPKPAALLARLKQLQPGIKRLGVVAASLEDGYFGLLRKEAAAAGVELRFLEVEDPESLPDRLRAARGKVDALWLSPQPGLVTPRSFATIREFARSQRVAFYAPTEGLLAEGATAVIAATFRDIGRAAAEAAQVVLDGHVTPDEVFPERVHALVNRDGTTLVGLTLSTSAVRQGGQR